MTNLTDTLLACAAGTLLVTAPGLRTQTPGPFAGDRGASQRRSVLFDAPDPHSLWAKGTTYKVHFAGGSAAFVPVFGRRAGRNLPLTLRLAEARLGQRELSLRPPTLAREADRVLLDHGDVREIWRLAADHAEQDFVVAGAAGTDAALHLRLRVATELAAPSRDPAGGLRFAASGLGAVHYGDAIVIDGAGRRLGQPVAFVDGAIELTVPADFVRSAREPITVDPVIRVVTVDNSAPTQQRADVAYEANAAVWLVVYEEVVSASDTDVIARRFDLDGGLLDEVAVDVSNDDTVRASVASTSGQFLVVWEKFSSVTSKIRGRTRTSSSTAQGVPFTIYDAPLLNDVGAPDVGGAPHTGDRNYFVVWHELVGAINRKIAGCLVTSQGLTGSAVEVANELVDLSIPAISKSSGSARGWLVAYRRGGLSPDIAAAVVDRSGAVTKTGFAITNSAVDDTAPDVAGNGADFLVVWQSGDGDTDILGKRLRLQGSLLALTGALNLTQLEPGTTPAAPQTRPRVASHGCRWTYTYEEGSAGPNNRDVHAAVVVGSSTLTYVEGHVLLSGGGAPFRSGGVAAIEEAGATGPVCRAFATFADGDISGALFDARQSGGGVSRVSTGCGGRGIEPGITEDGDPVLGARFTVTVHPKPGSATAIFIGLPAPPLVLCPLGCALGVAPILLSVPATSVTLTVPCNPSLLLGQFAFQGVEVPLDPASTCTIGVPLRTTDTVVATLR